MVIILREGVFFYTRAQAVSKKKIYSALHKLDLISDLLPDQNRQLQLDFPFSSKEASKIDQILAHLHYDKTKKLITVSPVSRRLYKRWPLEKFAFICDHLIEHWQAQLMFICSVDEMPFIEKLRELMRCQDLGNYPVLNLIEVRALLERVDLHFGNDNGVRHFAIAAGKRTLAIFGQGHVYNWTPPDQDLHQTIEYDPGCKSNCVYPRCQLECIHDITTDAVKAKIDQIMKTYSSF